MPALVSIVNENVPHIRHVNRARVQTWASSTTDRAPSRSTIGFNDSQDVLKALDWAQGKLPELELDPGQRVLQGASCRSCG